jgi:hypothetical protein
MNTTMLYESKSRPWSSLDVLRVVSPGDITLPADERAANAESLWEDLCSEYDAENLCLELERRHAAGLDFSEEFWSLEKAWRRDEFNHYLGFRRLYSLMYDLSEDEIARRVSSRVPNFAPFDDLLRDEFTLCLMLAYDELATTRSYAQDIPFYRSLGHPAIGEWIVQVRADEALHYRNAVGVTLARHADRLAEAPAILSHILSLDLGSAAYEATFIFDHKGPTFPPEMLRGCVATVIEVLQRPQADADSP